MRDLVNLFIAGLDRGANFALIALGLTLVFGTLGVVNFAHGALFMLGALVLLGTRYFFETQFITDTSAAPIKDFLGNEVFPQVSLGEYLLGAGTESWLYQNSLLIAVFVTIIFMALVAWGIERGIIRFFYRRPHAEQILVTFGLAVVLGEVVRALVGASGITMTDMRPAWLTGTFKLGGGYYFGWIAPSFDMEKYRAFLVVIAGAIIAGVFALIQLTRFGMIIRSGMQDRQMVGLLGINIQRRFTLMFILGSVIAGLAGLFYVPTASFSNNLGMEFLVIAFVVVVVGGMGSISGAVLAGFILGIAQTVSSHGAIEALIPGLNKVIIYLVAVVILLTMPRGLLGRRGVMEE